jgi:hypothetical protein
MTVHTRERFEFIADAPLDVAWPLFGADAERALAPDWHPAFIWPAPASDEEGMVFKVAHGAHTAVWVNTALDRAAGRIQYVERTALADAAGEVVSQMAGRDKLAGPEWAQQINKHLRDTRQSLSDHVL